VPLLFTGPKP
jgi:hypothetical protein